MLSSLYVEGVFNEALFLNVFSCLPRSYLDQNELWYVIDIGILIYLSTKFIRRWGFTLRGTGERNPASKQVKAVFLLNVNQGTDAIYEIERT